MRDSGGRIDNNKNTQKTCPSSGPVPLFPAVRRVSLANSFMGVQEYAGEVLCIQPVLHDGDEVFKEEYKTLSILCTVCSLHVLLIVDFILCWGCSVFMSFLSAWSCS